MHHPSRLSSDSTRCSAWASNYLSRRQSVRRLRHCCLMAGTTAALLSLVSITPISGVQAQEIYPMIDPSEGPEPFLPSGTPALVAQEIVDPVEIEAIASVGMTVSDMDRAIAFYEQVLDFTKISDVEVHGRNYELMQGVFGIRMRVVQLQLGDEIIELTDYLTVGGRPIPIDSRSTDQWFQHIAIVVSDMDAAYQRLRTFNVQHVSTGPQRLPETIPAAAGIEAFYFQDPDGHNLELIYFPPDKGDPRWQEPTDELFLGIDHTAIGIADTETSRQFYEDLLGLEIVGNSMNAGTEQEHLNNVFGARLNITGLRANEGIGLEFLDYLSPATGRPYPADSQAHDLWHWETTVVVANADAVAARLQDAGVPFVSSGTVEFPGRSLGFAKGFLVRDPDGHVIRIIER
ncbi:MAG: VOC family protein [Cyanobacteria bacterium P01_A01_bin.37]